MNTPFCLEPVHNEGLIFTECAHECLDGFEPGAHGSGAPFLQVPLGPVRAPVVPEELEAVVEQISPHALQVVLQDIGRLGSLPVGQVLLILPEAVLGALEDAVAVSFPRQILNLGGAERTDQSFTAGS